MRYGVICPDPPWWFAEIPSKYGPPPYPKMKLPELIAMKPQVDAWAADVCALAMWYTGPKADEAYQLGRAWGFEFVTVLFVWCKTAMHQDQLRLVTPDEPDDFNVYSGTGRYTAHGTEFMGLWRRGSLPPVADKTIRQVIHAPVREHSRKPREAYERLERLWPDAKRLEMFARTKRPGWDVFGDQVDKFGTAQ